MSKWKAPMPKEPPAAGHAHVVVAFKTEFGRRFEFTGQISRELADKIMVEVCTAASADRPTAQGSGIQKDTPP